MELKLLNSLHGIVLKDVTSDIKGFNNKYIFCGIYIYVHLWKLSVPYCSMGTMFWMENVHFPQTKIRVKI